MRSSAWLLRAATDAEAAGRSWRRSGPRPACSSLVATSSFMKRGHAGLERDVRRYILTDFIGFHRISSDFNRFHQISDDHHLDSRLATLQSALPTSFSMARRVRSSWRSLAARCSSLRVLRVEHLEFKPDRVNISLTLCQYYMFIPFK